MIFAAISARFAILVAIGLTPSTQSLAADANAARSTNSKTEVVHSLQLALTNTSCDSVLSPAQCMQILVGSGVVEFTTVSVDSWVHAMAQIDGVLNKVVSIDQETVRWKAIRGLSIQARDLVTKFNDAHEIQVPERQTPQLLFDLKSKTGVEKVEITHRLVVSGDRLLVDHILIDRTVSNQIPNAKGDVMAPILAVARASELSTDIAVSLGSNITTSMLALTQSAQTSTSVPTQ